MSNSIVNKVVSGVSALATVASLAAAPFTAFAAPMPGEVYSTPDGTVHFITSDNMRRAFTSAGAFTSYGFLSFSQVRPATAEVLALPAGPLVPPQDGKLICSDRGADKGTCYLITGGQKAGFTSASVFTGLGFSFSRTLSGDVSFLPTTTNIDSATQAHRAGVLVNNGGTIQLVGTSSLMGVPSIDTFNSWGYSFADTVPANAADRALPQSGVMMSRVAGQLSPTSTTTPVPTTGAVTVRMNSNTPVSATVPTGSTHVMFTKFDLVNGTSSPVTATGVTVKRNGSGSPSDFANVYLYNGDMRLTTGRTVNISSNTAAFNSLNVMIPANSSVTLDVVADMSASAGANNTHQLNVESVTLNSGTAVGTAMGNPMSIASVAAGRVTVKKSGTISNPKVGQVGAKVAEFRLEADAAEDLQVKSLTLYVGGNINRSNFTNIKLMQGGQQVATGVLDSNGSRIVFGGMSYALDRGNQRTFEVYADIGGAARSGDILSFYFEEDTDVFVMGRVFGFGARVDRATSPAYDGSPCATTGDDCSYSTIEGGRFTITQNGPATTDISPNAQDVPLLNLTITSQNNVEVRRINFQFDATGTSGADNLLVNTPSTSVNYRDIKLIDTANNMVVSGPKDLSSTGGDTQQAVQFTDTFTMNAGQTRTFRLTADLAQFTAAANETVKVSLTPFGGNDIRNLENSTFFGTSDIVPSTNVPGNIMNVRPSSLTIGAAGTPSAQTYVVGKQASAIAGFNFVSGTGRDSTIRSIKVTLAGANACAAAAIKNCVLGLRLMDGTNQVGQAETLTGSGPYTATFNNLVYQVPRGQTKTLTLVTDIPNNQSLSGGTITASIAASSDVTAQDPDGNAITPTGTATTPTFTLAGVGTLTVAADTSITQNVNDAHVIVANKANQSVARYKFTSTNEETRITQLPISIGSAAKEEVVRVRLFNGATEIAAPGVVPDSVGVARFVATSGGELFKVPKNSDTYLTVVVDTAPVKNTGATSGTIVATQINIDGTTAGDVFEAIGSESGTTLTDPGAVVLSSHNSVIYNSRPTFTLVSLPDSVLTGGTKVLSKFTVTADANDKISLKKLTFTISTSTNPTLASFGIRRSGDSNDISSVTFTPTTVSAASTTAVGVVFGSEESISAGQSQTYELRGVVGGTLVNGDNISTSITNSDAAEAGTANKPTAVFYGSFSSNTTVLPDSAGSATFVWSDNAAIPHTDVAPSSADFGTGFLVKLPTDSQSLLK